MKEGIMLIDKPEGITSFDVIRELRKKMRDVPQNHSLRDDGVNRPQPGRLKFGHAGTLDPAASGLMLVGVGSGTKELAHLIKLDKTYVAGVVLGETTDTLDRDGEVVERIAVPDAVTEERVRDIIAHMAGIHTLSVPAYSAIKINGTPLYRYARDGRLDEIDIPEKDMRVDAISLVACEETKTDAGRALVCEIEMDVGSGTYVRSIAAEIGRRLNVPARLETLRRTRIGSYAIEDAHTLADI